MKKLIWLSLTTLLFSLGSAQIGQNFSLDLSRSFSKKNVAFSNGILTEISPSKKSAFTSELLSIPKVDEKQAFIALAVNLEYIENNEVPHLEYRCKTKEQLSEWQIISADEHSPNSNLSFNGKQIYLAAETQEIQFRIKNNTSHHFELSTLNYRLFFPSISSSFIKKEETNTVSTKAINCSCPIPAVELRSDWCPSGTCPKDASPSSTTVTHLVVHHSAGSNNSPDWAATVRSIWDFHVNSNGWDDIGYNYLIDPNGVIYEGRGNDVSGAHFSCMNPGTMGVCLLGNFNNVVPSSAMINSLTQIMAWKACDIDEDPRDTTFFNTGSTDLINLCGHRDGNSIPASCTVTECPGNNVYSIMNTIRNKVFNYSQSCMLNPLNSDIIITSMDASTDPIYVNEPISLNLSYRNSGDETINENLTISYQINSNEIATSSFASLAVSETKSESQNYTFTSPGTYSYCCYIDAASNEINSLNNSFCIDLTVIDTIPTSITSLTENKYKIYPNPVKDILKIEGLTGTEEMILFNTLGQEILRSKETSFDMRSIANGFYTLKITSSAKNTSVFHFIKD